MEQRSVLLVSNEQVIIDITQEFLPKEFKLESIENRDYAVLSLLNREKLPEFYLLDYGLGYSNEHPDDINYNDGCILEDGTVYHPRFPIEELADFLFLKGVQKNKLFGYIGIHIKFQRSVRRNLEKMGIKSIPYPMKFDNTLEQLLKL